MSTTEISKYMGHERYSEVPCAPVTTQISKKKKKKKKKNQNQNSNEGQNEILDKPNASENSFATPNEFALSSKSPAKLNVSLSCIDRFSPVDTDLGQETYKSLESDLLSPQLTTDEQAKAPNLSHVKHEQPKLQGFADYVFGEVQAVEKYPTAEVPWGQTEREKVYNFLLFVPYQLERLLFFGTLLCVDSFVGLLTMLPVRCARALWQLLQSIFSRQNSQSSATPVEQAAVYSSERSSANEASIPKLILSNSGTTNNKANNTRNTAHDDLTKSPGRAARSYRLSIGEEAAKNPATASLQSNSLLGLDVPRSPTKMAPHIRVSGSGADPVKGPRGAHSRSHSLSGENRGRISGPGTPSHRLSTGIDVQRLSTGIDVQLARQSETAVVRRLPTSAEEPHSLDVESTGARLSPGPDAPKGSGDFGSPGTSMGQQERGSCNRRINGSQLFDLLSLVILLSATTLLRLVRPGMIYYWMKDITSEFLKMSVLVSVFEISDRILCNFGVDVLEALSGTCTLWMAGSRAFYQLAADTTVALGIVTLHALVLMCQGLVLAIALSSKRNGLLALLIASNFVEIKGSVFKRWDAPRIYNLAKSDVVERFHLIAVLCFLAVEEMENSGSWLPSATMIQESGRILAAEVVIDTLKHAVLGKWNDVRPGIYREFMMELCEGTTTAQSHNLHKLLGFHHLGVGALCLRVLVTLLFMRLESGSVLFLRLSLCALVWSGLLAFKQLFGYALKSTAHAYVAAYNTKLSRAGHGSGVAGTSAGGGVSGPVSRITISGPSVGSSVAGVAGASSAPLLSRRASIANAWAKKRE